MMHHCKHSLLKVMAGIVMMLAFAACTEPIGGIDPEGGYDVKADHTVLMYMVGDNNLSDLLENNVVQAHRAMMDSVAAGKLNLVVFKDNKRTPDNLPKLYAVHRNAMHRLDTVMIRRWDTEVDAADPGFLAEVVQTAFREYNTEIKGLVLASHASSWAPLLNSRNYAVARRAFGQDQNTSNNQTGSVELWDLGDALLTCPHLDYIIMDCCHMGTAEVAYQMRDVTHYLVASACEIEGKGFPYLNVMTRLSKCRTANDLPDALDYAARCYYNEHVPYNGQSRKGATIALYDLSSMTTLADSYRQLVASNASRLNALAAGNADALALWAETFQPYGREYKANGQEVHYKYYFHDMLDVIDWMGQQNATAATSARMALSRTVLNEYHSTQFWSEIPIDHSCGIGVTLPEALSLAKSSAYSAYFKPFTYTKLSAAYKLTDWAKAVGY